MDEQELITLREAVVGLKRRADESQDTARDLFAPMFRANDRKAPGDFVDSSYLYMRSCDIDQGFRPSPCRTFWNSPDLEVEAISNQGLLTPTLIAGNRYRLNATVRNRGDLAVPAAKVEFWLANPSLGMDTRFATKLGVAQGRVQAHGATKIGLDYEVPPTLAGHFCLFARVFSFAPLDTPVSDYALDPNIDRHVAQLNLNIVAPSQAMMVNWIHHRNAQETVMLLPMMPAEQRALRHELLTPLRLVSSRAAAEIGGRAKLEAVLPEVEGMRIAVEQTDEGLRLVSRDPDAVSIEAQMRLTKRVTTILQNEDGMPPAERRKLMAEYRAMTAQTVRTEVQLHLPDVALEKGQAAAFQLLRRNEVSGEITGGVTIYLTP